MTLMDLKSGMSGIVDKITADGFLAQRLIDMGLYPGTSVTFIRKAPLGDPVEIEAEGTSISLRREEAWYVRLKA